jgi:hypothetical protein
LIYKERFGKTKGLFSLLTVIQVTINRHSQDYPFESILKAAQPDAIDSPAELLPLCRVPRRMLAHDFMKAMSRLDNEEGEVDGE